MLLQQHRRLPGRQDHPDPIGRYPPAVEQLEVERTAAVVEREISVVRERVANFLRTPLFLFTSMHWDRKEGPMYGERVVTFLLRELG